MKYKKLVNAFENTFPKPDIIRQNKIYSSLGTEIKIYTTIYNHFIQFNVTTLPLKNNNSFGRLKQIWNEGYNIYNTNIKSKNHLITYTIKVCYDYLSVYYRKTGTVEYFDLDSIDLEYEKNETWSPSNEHIKQGIISIIEFLLRVYQVTSLLNSFEQDVAYFKSAFKDTFKPVKEANKIPFNETENRGINRGTILSLYKELYNNIIKNNAIDYIIKINENKEVNNFIKTVLNILDHNLICINNKCMFDFEGIVETIGFLELTDTENLLFEFLFEARKKQEPNMNFENNKVFFT
jgi:methionine synthase II (cobalamin-independent)